MSEQLSEDLKQLLVCPVCKGKLAFAPGVISCHACGHRFTQPAAGYVDLLPQPLLADEGTRWEERQQEMDAWYEGLIARPARAKEDFGQGYAPYAPLLATLSGTILDVGGGIGVVRHFLAEDTDYIVVDPSLTWLRDEWASLATWFPDLETRPRFIRGIGEYLPFPPEAFDAVLAFWSLNHASDPGQVCHEVGRVLRPGGRFVVVLEDMTPSERDIAENPFLASSLANAHEYLGIEPWTSRAQSYALLTS
jgi:SAM-dependent methyltransferase